MEAGKMAAQELEEFADQFQCKKRLLFSFTGLRIGKGPESKFIKIGNVHITKTNKEFSKINQIKLKKTQEGKVKKEGQFNYKDAEDSTESGDCVLQQERKSFYRSGDNRK